ncbi:MAG TPA: isoaspartyl peptidase/L-asparaginase [Candidatus Dormibacteraeota bacterium]|nr:isoaspartyl peptidase/L-asparaginase [Candidatus Dormibacteraeota bacterium]
MTRGSRGLTRRVFFRRAGLLGGAALASGAVTCGPGGPDARGGRAAAPGAVTAPAGAPARAPATGKAIMVGSANALPGMERAMHLLKGGPDPLGAVLDAIHMIEDDPNDVTVGYGGIPNEDGIVELDASVMEGATLRSGSVGALRSIRHPSTAARLVMERSDRVFLVGEGALRFARAHGLPEENLLTERSRKIWLYWKERLSGRDDWIEAAGETDDPDIRWFIDTYGDEDFRPQGTIHISALAPAGTLVGCTSTSGLFFKLPGRLGDSPVVGAGLYTDDGAGSCGSTGRGEATIAICGSHTVVEHMRQGAPPEESGLRALRRIVDAAKNPRHLFPDGRPRFDVKFYCLDARGETAGVSIWGGARYAVHDGARAVLKDCASLFGRPPQPL